MNEKSCINYLHNASQLCTHGLTNAFGGSNIKYCAIFYWIHTKMERLSRQNYLCGCAYFIYANITSTIIILVP